MEEKYKTSRQLQAEAMKEKLQDIVQDMCRTKTLDEIRIKDIAAAANISMGNFYQYFDSKEAALIYSYKVKDGKWETLHFEEIKDPLERVERIVATHLYAMIENSLCFDTQLYIAQLKEYDGYFFTDDRYLTRIMQETIETGQNEGSFKKDWTPMEIGIRILNFSRGLVYNYCIMHREDPDNWILYALKCQEEYMSLFVTDPSRIDLKKHYDAARSKGTGKGEESKGQK